MQTRVEQRKELARKDLEFAVSVSHIFSIVVINKLTINRCTVTLGCGAQTNENCTYFEEANKAITAGPCQARICKMNANICQVYIKC